MHLGRPPPAKLIKEGEEAAAGRVRLSSVHPYLIWLLVGFPKEYLSVSSEPGLLRRPSHPWESAGVSVCRHPVLSAPPGASPCYLTHRWARLLLGPWAPGTGSFRGSLVTGGGCLLVVEGKMKRRYS